MTIAELRAALDAAIAQGATEGSRLWDHDGTVCWRNEGDEEE